MSSNFQKLFELHLPFTWIKVCRFFFPKNRFKGFQNFIKENIYFDIVDNFSKNNHLMFFEVEQIKELIYN